MKKLFATIMLLALVMASCSTKDQSKVKDKPKQSGSGEEVELTISAAASLQDALYEITANFNKKHPHVKINFNFGSSGALHQQIFQGAPVDLFFSAAEDKFDQLVKEGLIDKDQSVDLIGNEMVLVVPIDADKGINKFEDLPKADTVSIGTPESVPAGKYAKEILENINVWKAVEGKTVYAKDVRQVLTYVETGNVDAGIVYKTDAMISPKVKIIATADEKTHGPIIYPIGVIKNTAHMEKALLFYEYLQNEQSMKTYKKYGFKELN